MASRCLKLLKIIRINNIVHRSITSGSVATPEEDNISKAKEYKIKENFIHLDDPDSFGALSRKITFDRNELQDEGDIKEEQYLQNAPLSTQKLTTKQYADLIKQYLKYHRLKEAIDVLEVRMLTVDRVKPENYIYNILIGACAEVGYTKKAFKLYNEMKRRALKPTGDTFTCLFHACANSPFPSQGLKQARNLRSLMIEKGIEPNLTNYNSMIKAFGRCGDLPTAFKIVDEMVSKRIDIRVHTFNHLLHACITDKNTGLRHALVVWRKMLKLREKPNIYTFNLMLKCVKECNLGSREDIAELIGIIQEQISMDGMLQKNRQIKPLDSTYYLEQKSPLSLHSKEDPEIKSQIPEAINQNSENFNASQEHSSELVVKEDQNELRATENDTVSITFVDQLSKPMKMEEKRTVPNLLSKNLNMDQVLALQEVHTLQDKFAVIGGQEDFLNEMKVYCVNPDIKTFTQMLPLIEDTREAELKLLETMKNLNLKADIDLYNMLIKKRCLRSDYEGAFDVRNIIEEEDKYRRKKYSLKKNLRLKLNIMSYGALALACNTKETAEKLLNEMKQKKLKVNIQILGTLLRHGTAHCQFPYIIYIMNIVQEENIKVNDVFLKHLENFNDKCLKVIKEKSSESFAKAYRNFSHIYSKWLKEVDVQEALQPDHPWAQFQESYPETIQRQNVTIQDPKRFYKRKSRMFVPYKV